jgi:hypothetical protein
MGGNVIIFWPKLDNWRQKSENNWTNWGAMALILIPPSHAQKTLVDRHCVPRRCRAPAPPPYRFGAACPGCSSCRSSPPLPCHLSRYVNETLILYPMHYFDLAQMNQKICMCMLRSSEDLPISSLRYLATSSSFSYDLDILKDFFPKFKWFKIFVLICMLIPSAWVPIKK